MQLKMSDGLAIEFANHKKNIATLRDDIDKLLAAGNSEEVQKKMDIATTAIGNLEKSKKGFNAIVKIHYPEEKDRNVLYGK